MTARYRSRTFLVGAAVAALLAPLALVASFATPASAAPGKPHEVYMYKVEKHVDLSGEFPDQNMHEHVYCDPGDIALDGMWRVDHVDQENPQLGVYGDERDVYFSASYADPHDHGEWHFRATNFADGDAQLKLFVTCIRGQVEQAYGHRHPVQVTTLDWEHHNGLAPGAGHHDWGFSGQCAPGTYAVAPGFNVTSSTFGSKARIFQNWPSSNFRGWHWAFLVNDDHANISVFLKCLRTKVGGAGNGPHSHELPATWRPFGSGGWLQHLDVHGAQERRLNCDDGSNGKLYQDYKAMVGAFWIDPHDVHHIWYLGMDPRPKQRAYKFWWDGHGGNGVYVGALCIRARTGKQIAP